MSLEDFADTNGLVMEVHERDVSVGNPMRYYAHFSACDVAKGGFLGSDHGNGATQEEAIADYASVISLKKIVVNAHTKKSRRINVPRLTR
jgi:hypothetical protein